MSTMTIPGRYIRETLAATQHDIWAHWMRYMLDICLMDSDGNVIIPSDKVTRWERQISTPYGELTEKEKDSDREQADKIITSLEDLLSGLI